MKNETSRKEILIETCCAKGQSPHICSAFRGVKLTHKATGIVVYSTKEKSQQTNHLVAMELLKLELVKQRFENIEENDLIDGEAFREQLNSGKFD